MAEPTTDNLGKGKLFVRKDGRWEELVVQKHGRWLWRSFNIMCSECDFMPNFDSTEPLYTYCPNCGAKMDGGDT